METVEGIIKPIGGYVIFFGIHIVFAVAAYAGKTASLKVKLISIFIFIFSLLLFYETLKNNPNCICFNHFIPFVPKLRQITVDVLNAVTSGLIAPIVIGIGLLLIYFRRIGSFWIWRILAAIVSPVILWLFLNNAIPYWTNFMCQWACQ